MVAHSSDLGLASTSFVENIKQEVNKNKEIKDNIKKFREEAQKLEQSEALKNARSKFNAVESEAFKSSNVLKERIDGLKEKVQDVIDEAGKSDIAKKAGQFTEGLGKSPKNEITSDNIQGRVYSSPLKLRKRVEIETDAKEVQPDAETLGVELHKDYKIFQSWENFKNNNTYVNKVLDWKMKYDESENTVIRASRLLTDKVSDIMGNLFSKTELSETLTELCKIDPNFDEKQFLRFCETDIIPNILESICRGNLDILKDWCFESTYNIIATPLSQAIKSGYKLDSKILDIENVELAMGKVMEQGPVLIITFQTQQILCVRDSNNAVVEGDPDKVMRVNYVWVLCRDPNELNPRAAWRLMELSASSQEQLV
uniref:Mitochondrial import inner membrane translocase subunit TIM44 n=1 Tax=Megaselia scalaris TaxID=36166 RepID=T1GFL3_MEGSC